MDVRKALTYYMQEKYTIDKMNKRYNISIKKGEAF